MKHLIKKTAIHTPKWWGSNFSCNVIDAYLSGELNYNNIEEWETKYNNGIKPIPSLGTKAILDYYLKTKINPCNEKNASAQTNIDTYSDRIMKNVRQNLGLEEDDTSRDEYIMSLSPEDVFDRYCNWEGLINYGYTLWHVMEELQSFK